MVEVNTNVSAKHGSEIVSADVTLYNDENVIVKKICITDESTLKELEERVIECETNYYDRDEITNILKNDNLTYNINATTVAGKDLTHVVTMEDIERLLNGKSDKPHAVINGDEYGKGSTSKYGHVRLVNNLGSSAFVDGEALAANQGKIINDLINTVQEQNNLRANKYYKNSLQVRIGRIRNNKREGEYGMKLCTGTGDGIYAHVTCDMPDYTVEGKKVMLVINGAAYERTTDQNGYTSPLNINWTESKDVIVDAFIAGNESRGLKSTSTSKEVFHNPDVEKMKKWC